ncbi:ISAzo13-like element transposase-related protein, partial [Streptomyces vinaceus]
LDRSSRPHPPHEQARAAQLPALRLTNYATESETGLQITVCHLPLGTSKWNKIEHRLFSHIAMNWRGRPLISHDVIVSSIAATTTRTGLKVRAELGTGTCATGMKVTDAEIDALPMHRHCFHGDWNCTLAPACLHPAPAPTENTSTADTSPAGTPGRFDTACLRAPELTGMTIPQLNTLINSLIPALTERREQSRNARRGGERRRAPGAGARDQLPMADRILATVLYLRKLGTHELLAKLFGITRSTLTRAVQEVQPLLDEHGHTIPPSTARFSTPVDVTAFLSLSDASTEIKRAC